MIESTRFIGINVLYDSGVYWIVDDNGNSMHFGKNKPTEKQVVDYRNEVCRYKLNPVE